MVLCGLGRSPVSFSASSEDGSHSSSHHVCLSTCMIHVRLESRKRPTSESLPGSLGPPSQGSACPGRKPLVPLAVGGAAQETDIRVLPQPPPPQRVVTGRDRDWGNQSAILSESGLWQAAPNPRASLTQPAD